MLEAHVKNRNFRDLSITFSYDGPQLLGTAGAIKKALPLLGPEFFILYGDSYLICDYARVENSWRISRKTALMTVYRNSGKYERSNVEFLDGVILAYDKKSPTPAMEYIDYGLGVSRASAFESLPEDEPTDLASVYQDLLVRGELAALEEPYRFYEIGSPAGLDEFRRYAAFALRS